MPQHPTGLALSADGSRLYVTCADATSQVCVVDASTGGVVERLSAAHTAMSPVISRDGRTLFVCNRFNNDVSVIDLKDKRETHRVAVQREPVAADLAGDGRFLLVANRLPTGRADADFVSVVVSVIDVASGKVIKELSLPIGGGMVNGFKVSPDGQHAVVTHLLSRFYSPTTHLERGAMNANALTVLDLKKMTVLNTVLLDEIESGAANPWGVAWTADSQTVVVTHAGSHEVSVIDFKGLLARLTVLPMIANASLNRDYAVAARTRADVPHDLTFLNGIRRRIKLTPSDRGPRTVVVTGHQAWVANYFSDSLAMIDLAAMSNGVVSISLGGLKTNSLVRLGEMYFNDASICNRGWQSCASCHPGEARMDGLNWDLLNDGIGNTKNTKSLLLAHKTPPAMTLGVRETAETAVRAGIKHILFTQQSEEVAVAIDEYLKSLKPVPSPHRVGGKLSESALRGEKLFMDSKVACARCHPSGLFTDLRRHNVGTSNSSDPPNERFDTPTLIEVWRTAPYLHDGSAATMRDVLTTANKDDRHGRTSQLTPQEIDDLAEYVLSQ
jgi:YVTN family beta-propeller protein